MIALEDYGIVISKQKEGIYMSYGYRQYRDTAHRLTQIGVGLISVIAGLILIVCVTAPMYVSSMLKDAGLSAAISHRFMDTVLIHLGIIWRHYPEFRQV